MNELRDFDKQTLVLYTDDRTIANRVGGWRECCKTIPYEQEQYKNKRVALIGIDFYLPKTKRILKRLNQFADLVKV